MKYLAWVMGILLAMILCLAAAERLAAERIEVVEIHAKDSEGATITTRLWVVDHKGGMYLRVGSDGSGWYSRLQANDEIEVTRGDLRSRVTAIPEPAESAVVNQLMQEKYTWGDTFISKLVGSREGSIPIRLEPVQ